MNILERRIRTNRGFRQLVEPVYYWLNAFGINPRRLITSAGSFHRVVLDYIALRRQNRELPIPYRLRFCSPSLHEKRTSSGSASGHYFHQDLLVARKVFERSPERHVDIASRVDGFVAHVASFRPIEVFDIRPLKNKIPNIIFHQCDLMVPQEEQWEYCDSLSCLHALEHFGLGRYGDPINIEGHRDGFRNLARILRRNGMLYLSVPIGPERIDFNGHRVLNVRTILDLARDEFELIGFSYVDDQGDLQTNIELTNELIKNNCECYYGCGIFEFKKTGSTLTRSETAN